MNRLFHNLIILFNTMVVPFQLITILTISTILFILIKVIKNKRMKRKISSIKSEGLNKMKYHSDEISLEDVSNLEKKFLELHPKLKVKFISLCGMWLGESTNITFYISEDLELKFDVYNKDELSKISKNSNYIREKIKDGNAYGKLLKKKLPPSISFLDVVEYTKSIIKFYYNTDTIPINNRPLAKYYPESESYMIDVVNVLILSYRNEKSLESSQGHKYFDKIYVQINYILSKIQFVKKLEEKEICLE